MPRPRTLGAIPVADALAAVSKLLGRDPTTDPAVGLWAVARGNVAEGKLWGHHLPEGERRKVWLRRFARIDPRTATPQLPKKKPGKKKLGRPAEVGIDGANAFLLAHYPQLADHPLQFAMLEALFLLDLPEETTSRFPPPARWQGDRRWGATRQLRAVEERARTRLRRALKLLRSKKTARPAPARRRRARPRA